MSGFVMSTRYLISMLYIKDEQVVSRSKPFPIKSSVFCVWDCVALVISSTSPIVSTSMEKPRCFPFCQPLVYFIIQLILNLSWTTLFFKYHQVGWSLVSLVLIIVFTLMSIVTFRKYSTLASNLLIPYVLWLCFAAYLTLYIYLNN